jgi:hypothetical protein
MLFFRRKILPHHRRQPSRFTRPVRRRLGRHPILDHRTAEYRTCASGIRFAKQSPRISPNEAYKTNANPRPQIKTIGRSLKMLRLYSPSPVQNSWQRRPTIRVSLNREHPVPFNKAAGKPEEM